MALSNFANFVALSKVIFYKAPVLLSIYTNLLDKLFAVCPPLVLLSRERQNSQVHFSLLFSLEISIPLFLGLNVLCCLHSP